MKIYKKDNKSFDGIKKLIKKEVKKNELIKPIEIKEDNSDSENELERIQKVVLGKESKVNINLSQQLKQLMKKLELNEEIIKSETKINETKAIDGEFFYNSWKNSFDAEKFKSNKNFKKYVKKEKITGLANMGFYLKTLLDGFYIDIYADDPNQLDKKLSKDNKEF